MTTLVSMATRDCIVIGCDSLATISKLAIPLHSFWDDFHNDNGQPRVGEDGQPITKTISYADLIQKSNSLAFRQIPTVTKIYSLEPANAGILFAGIASIGDKSIKNLVDEFVADSVNYKFLKGAHTIRGIADRLSEFLAKRYKEAEEYGIMEILVSGYSNDKSLPEIVRILIQQDEELNVKPEIKEELKDGSYRVVFGGQHDVIERVVYGFDRESFGKAWEKVENALIQYRNEIKEKISDPSIEIPTIDELGGVNHFWGEGILFGGLSGQISNFSEQASIDFVDFLIDLMIKSQQFSDKLPTVGGDIHIALITKTKGFKWISKETYGHRGNEIPKYED